MRVILPVILFLPLPVTALGQTPGLRGDRAAFQSFLAGRCDEAPAARGIAAGGGHVVELVMSGGGKSWTILVTDTAGIGCGLASGRAREPMTALRPTEPPA